MHVVNWTPERSHIRLCASLSLRPLTCDDIKVTGEVLGNKVACSCIQTPQKFSFFFFYKTTNHKCFLDHVFIHLRGIQLEKIPPKFPRRGRKERRWRQASAEGAEPFRWLCELNTSHGSIKRQPKFMTPIYDSHGIFQPLHSHESYRTQVTTNTLILNHFFTPRWFSNRYF